MNKVISVLLAVVIAFTLSCRSDSNSINDNNSTEEIPLVGRSIKFDPSDSSPVFIEDIADTMFFVPLATKKGFFIAHINNLYFSDKLIIIPQESQGEILIFDMDGKPVRKLSIKGDGPGKVPGITHTWYNKEAALIEVYSAQLGKILFYNLEGQFVKDVKVEGPKGLEFASSGEGYVFERIMEGIDNNTRLGIFSKDLEFIKSDYKIPQRLEKVSLGRYNPLASYNDTIYYLPILDHRIYTVTGEGARTAYTFDIPKKYQASTEYLNEPSFNDFNQYYDEIAKTNLLSQSGWLYITDKYVHFSYRTPGKSFVSTVLYSKKSKEVLHFQGFRSREMPAFNFYTPVKGFMNDYCITYLNTSYRDILPQEIRKNLHEGSNPVLLFFRLKDF